MNLSNSNILLLSHVTDLSGPTEALEVFLLKNRVSLLNIICNPLEYCTINRRSVKLYIDSNILKEIYPTNSKCGRILTWCLDCSIAIYYSIRFRYKYKVTICCGALDGLMGLLLKKLRRVQTIVWYSIDWTPVRFKNRLLNTIYHNINYFGLKHADIVWSCSERLSDLYIEKGVDPTKIQYVPQGVEDVSGRILFRNNDRKTLVFLGALEKTKGIDLVIEAWPFLIKEDPEFKLVIIGKTPGNRRFYEQKLEKLPNVEILGVLPHDKVLEILPKYGIGLAPYTSDYSSITYYTHPARIKDYLACGLPIIVTSVPEIADEIEENHAGKIIDYSLDGLIEGVVSLTKDSDLYNRFKKNAVELSKKYNWDNIFAEALEKLK